MDGRDSHNDRATERLIVQLYEQLGLSPWRNLGALRDARRCPQLARPQRASTGQRADTSRMSPLPTGLWTTERDC